MLEEMMNDILRAEQDAEERIAGANQEAKAVLAEAEKEREEILLAAKKDASELMRTLEEDTRSVAKGESDAIIRRGTDEADKQYDSMKKNVRSAAQKIADEIFEKYGVTSL